MPGAPDEQLSAVIPLGKRPAADDTANTCPACRYTVVGLKLYIRHVGRHLEQLSLFALPSLEDENHSEGSGSEEESWLPSLNDEVDGIDIFRSEVLSLVKNEGRANDIGSEERDGNRSQTSSNQVQVGCPMLLQRASCI